MSVPKSGSRSTVACTLSGSLPVENRVVTVG
jgi:hypothetical protein